MGTAACRGSFTLWFKNLNWSSLNLKPYPLPLFAGCRRRGWFRLLLLLEDVWVAARRGWSVQEVRTWHLYLWFFSVSTGRWWAACDILLFFEDGILFYFFTLAILLLVTLPWWFTEQRHGLSLLLWFFCCCASSASKAYVRRPFMTRHTVAHLEWDFLPEFQQVLTFSSTPPVVSSCCESHEITSLPRI